MRIIGVIVLIVSLCAGVWFELNTKGLDIPSLLIVLGAGLGFVLLSHTPGDIFNAFSVAFSSNAESEDAFRAKLCWKSAIRGVIYAGVIGTLIGLIQMLVNLSDPNALGPAASLGLLTTLYSLVAALLLPVPAYFACAAMEGDTDAGVDSERNKMSISCYVIGLFIVLGLIFASFYSVTGARLVFFDVPTFLIVFGSAIGAGLFSFGLPSENDEHPIERPRLLTTTFAIGMLVASIAGAAWILAHWGDTSQIGPGMAAILLGSLYALLGIGLVSAPWEDCIAKNRSSTSASSSDILIFITPAFALLIALISIAMLAYGVSML